LDILLFGTAPLPARALLSCFPGQIWDSPRSFSQPIYCIDCWSSQDYSLLEKPGRRLAPWDFGEELFGRNIEKSVDDCPRRIDITGR
jgi:hypothetical protein